MATTVKAIAGNDVKHGTVVVASAPFEDLALMKTYSGSPTSFVKNTPNPTTIGTKYDNRFDDPTYYTA